jgi:hypothetical protein
MFSKVSWQALQHNGIGLDFWMTWTDTLTVYCTWLGLEDFTWINWTWLGYYLEDLAWLWSLFTWPGPCLEDMTRLQSLFAWKCITLRTWLDFGHSWGLDKTSVTLYMTWLDFGHSLLDLTWLQSLLRTWQDFGHSWGLDMTSVTLENLMWGLGLTCNHLEDFTWNDKTLVTLDLTALDLESPWGLDFDLTLLVILWLHLSWDSGMPGSNLSFKSGVLIWSLFTWLEINLRAWLDLGRDLWYYDLGLDFWLIDWGLDMTQFGT